MSSPRGEMLPADAQEQKDLVLQHLNRPQMPPLPMMDSHFTRLTEHWFTYQGGICKNYELDFARCAGRVGVTRAPAECRRYYEDLKECIHNIKASARYRKMQQERKKQGKPFMEKPPPDSIYTFQL